MKNTAALRANTGKSRLFALGGFLGFASMLLLAAQSAFAAGPEANEDSGVFEVEKVRDDVSVILGGNGNGGHAGVVEFDDGLVLIDSMMEASRDRLLNTLREISKKPVKALINTHDHPDHIGSDAYLQGQGALVVASSSAEFEDEFAWQGIGENGKLPQYGDSIALYVVGSHSPSVLFVFLPESNVLFVGDTLSKAWYPANFHRGIRGQVEAMDLALNLIDEQSVVVPGHGFLTDRQGVQAYRESCLAWSARIMQLHHQGLQLADIIKDPELEKIRWKFNPRLVDRDRFDHFHGRLVENTIKAETAAAEEG